uniref:Uncharacterized protein n=1 Tax=Anguilla anguilla TaxID=7936 RepID=A0A0E9XHQ2_ANGAN
MLTSFFFENLTLKVKRDFFSFYCVYC